VAWALVHGFSQTPGSWDALAMPDATALRVPDDLGFAATASRLGDEGGQATYVGYSMGGRLCLQLALDRPELVERLVLISASPGIADDAERAARAEHDEELARAVERDGVDEFLEHWLAQPLFRTVPHERAGLDDRRAHNTVERLTHQLRALGQGAQPNNWGRLGELQMPVLILAGQLDEKYVDLAHRMHAEVDAGRRTLAVVPDAGHACHLEEPFAVARLLLDW
jgi:2-succinyl-6-hydroxy-2,4-cyclohexadiene-1-carboxylate synthase